MRKGVKAISVLLLFCVLLGFAGCSDKDKIVGKWKQSSYNSGYSKLKDEFGELEFTKTGKYKRVSSNDHIGFSGAATAESGSFKIDDKNGQIMFYPDDGKGTTWISNPDTALLSCAVINIWSAVGYDLVFFLEIVITQLFESQEFEFKICVIIK